VSEEELLLIQQHAQRSGVSVATFVRELALREARQAVA
jgi:uncharacterized protein (DUF1778 family)